MIKETNGSHAADLVMRVIPASRLLLLIRDGRDVVDSLLHAYQPGGFMANKQGRSFATPEQRAEGLGWAARLWACNTDMTLKAMESHPAELTRVVRYEDLLADTVGQVKGLYDWLGLERGRLARAARRGALVLAPPEGADGPDDAQPLRPPGPLAREPERRGAAQVNEICGPLLERFGYERSTLTGPIAPPPGRPAGAGPAPGPAADRRALPAGAARHRRGSRRCARLHPRGLDPGDDHALARARCARRGRRPISGR